jgi:hypothetical protein
MKSRPINKNNPKNIYCDHCEHWKHHSGYLYECINEKSQHYKHFRCYYNRCKAFEWKKDADYV